MPFREGSRKPEKDENGVTCFRCLWEGCNKTFGTAQHVRRHEKTHTGRTPFECPLCNKSFARSDVRAKHLATMHPGSGSGIGNGSGSAKNRNRDEARDRRGSENASLYTTNSSGGDSPPAKHRKFDYTVPNASSNQYRPPSPAQSILSGSTTSPEYRTRNDSLSMTWGDGLRVPASNQGLPMQILSMTQQQQAQGSHSGNSNANVNVNLNASVHNGNKLDSTLFNPAEPLIPNPGMMLPPPTPYSATSGSSGFLDPANLATGSSLSLDPVLENNLLDPFDTSWDMFGQAFGWGFENDIDLGIGLQNGMFDHSEVGPVSSTDTLSAAWLLSTTPRHGSPVGDNPAAIERGGSGVGTLESDQRTDPFGRKHDNPWPSIFKPKVPDRPLTLGGVKASPRPYRDRSSQPDAIGKTARNAMLSLIYLSHQNLWLMPDIGDFPDHETLSDFVDLYFEKFHPNFPILHKPTFSSSDTSALLLLSVAAVGATYAEKAVQPLAVALSELVRRIVTWMRASDQRAKFDRNVLTSYVLQAALDIACGSREMFLHAEIMRASICTTARRLHLLRPGRGAMDELLGRGSQPSVEERWRAYVEDEGRRRLGWGTFLLDAQMAALLGHPCMMSINEVWVPLPGDEAVWEAPDAIAWSKIVPTPAIPNTPTFPVALSTLLKGGDVALRDFGSAIVSHILYRFLMEAYHLSHALNPEERDSDAIIDGSLLSYLPAKLDSKPRKLLLQLAQSAFSLASPSHLRLSSAALFHHSYIAFARPGLLENIKAASGRVLPGMNKRDAVEWLEKWADNGKEVRMIIWHAGVLNALLAEFPQGALSELFWTFDCALVFWAVVKYAKDRMNSTELRSALFAANWFDTDPPPKWIDHGGQLMLPYLGSTSSLSVKTTLTFFMGRLETIPFGWATLFRQVLGKLSDAEDRGLSDDGDAQ